MNLPKEALLVLLNYARKGGDLNQEVFDAALEVLKYVWHICTSVVSSVESHEAKDMDIVSALEEVLNESEAKAFTPGIWITIGLWVVEKILKQVLK